LIPGTIRSVIRGERPIVRSDGTFIRDYFYVQDAVEAYLALAERMHEPDLHGEAFNFGTETPKSVLEIVAALLEQMGREDLAPVVQNQATHEIPRQFLDCAKARKRLHWKPRRSLEDGLRETIAWYRRALG
jgi:CDP-glucose 4,6-dehydratase